MKSIIARKGVWTYIDLCFRVLLLCIITYFFIDNIKNKAYDGGSTFFMIILFIAAAIPLIHFIYRWITTPKLLIIKKENDFVIYSDGACPLSIPMVNVVSVERKKNGIIINTNKDNYHVHGVLNPDKVMTIINKILENKKK